MSSDFYLYDLRLPYVIKEKVSPYTYENLRGPILATAFGLMMVYHLFWKQGAYFKTNSPPVNNDDDDLGELGNTLRRSMLKKG